MALDGEFTGFVSVSLINLESFRIKCTDKNSDTFVPRELHGSCESFDSKVWVFGGKQTVGKKDIALNDIMMYDANKNSWKAIIPSSGNKPTPRFGHVFFCYFQYLIVFGGESESGSILGDLWVFDTIAEKWTFIMDTGDMHAFEHLNIDTLVPKGRKFASSVMISDIGAGYITGGITTDGVACDIWGIKAERLVAYIEDSSKNPIENFWIK